MHAHTHTYTHTHNTHTHTHTHIHTHTQHTLTLTKHYPYWVTCPPKNGGMSSNRKVDYVLHNNIDAQHNLLYSWATPCRLCTALHLPIHSLVYSTQSNTYVEAYHSLMLKLISLLSKASLTLAPNIQYFSALDCRVSCVICSSLND